MNNNITFLSLSAFKWIFWTLSIYGAWNWGLTFSFKSLKGWDSYSLYCFPETHWKARFAVEITSLSLLNFWPNLNENFFISSYRFFIGLHVIVFIHLIEFSSVTHWSFWTICKSLNVVMQILVFIQNIFFFK